MRQAKGLFHMPGNKANRVLADANAWNSPEWIFRFSRKIPQESSNGSTVLLKDSSNMKTNSLKFNP
jgi:hypothetical protein